MWKYFFEIEEKDILEAYEKFPSGFEVMEYKPNGRMVLAIYSKNELEKFPFHLIKKEKVEKKDWKEFYKPIKIDEDLFIIPPWEAVKKEYAEKDTLIIKPGKAFGTGLHESTQLCLKFLKEIDI